MIEEVRWSLGRDHQPLEALLTQALAALRAHRGGAQALEEGAVLLGCTDEVVTPAGLLNAASATPGVKVAVATLDEVVVGLGLCKRDGSIGTILGCYVEPEARGVGCGQGLVRFLVEWLRDAGATRVDAIALPGDRLTKQLLESGGLKARRITMSVELG